LTVIENKRQCPMVGETKWHSLKGGILMSCDE
jgi:hypothetical protein